MSTRAINSAIDELIPAKYRGRVDIAVNGTYWVGAVAGHARSSLLLLNVLGDQRLGWRLGFLIGPVLGVVILFVRRNLPESPRWLIMHGRDEEAERLDLHDRTRGGGDRRTLSPVSTTRPSRCSPSKRTGYLTLVKVLFTQYPKRSVLGASLMITTGFLYNAIFFTYTLVLTKFYGISASAAPYFLIAFAVGNSGRTVRHRPATSTRSAGRR